MILTCATSGAQENYTLLYTIKGYTGSKAYLSSVHGHKYQRIDSLTHVTDGQLLFKIKGSTPAGVYRISFADSLFTDIVFNKENIELTNDLSGLGKNLKVISSRENVIFHRYWEITGSLSDSIDMIARTGDRMYELSGHKMTPQLDSMRRIVLTLKQGIAAFSAQLLQEAKGMFVEKIIRAYQTPDYYTYLRQPGAFPYDTPLDFLRDHYFDHVDMTDSLLLNTEIIYVIVTGYLNTIGDPPSSGNYNRAIDTIMKRAAQCRAIKEYALMLLLNTFENSNWEDVFIHLVDTYVLPGSCETSDAAGYAKKSEAIKNLAAGNPSPPMIINDVNGKSVSLYDVMAPATLVFFWSSDCPHCRKILPELKALYDTYHPKGLEIFAVACDTNERSWKDAVNDQHTKWINVSDLKGPESELLVEFHAWETPYFLLLDKQKTIISRPRMIAQIKEGLDRYLK